MQRLRGWCLWDMCEEQHTGKVVACREEAAGTGEGNKGAPKAGLKRPLEGL